MIFTIKTPVYFNTAFYTIFLIFKIHFNFFPQYGQYFNPLVILKLISSTNAYSLTTLKKSNKDFIGHICTLMIYIKIIFSCFSFLKYHLNPPFLQKGHKNILIPSISIVSIFLFISVERPHKRH